jgi:3-methyladenine DNA glycosylase AlkD
MTAEAAIARLRAQANPANVAGMARFGINPAGTLGVSVAAIRRLARESGHNHALALELWDSAVHEARILATIVDLPATVTPRQMDRWARQADSWDICDQACQNLFRHTPFAFSKAAEWARRKPEFLRRAGFVLMAGLAVKARTASDSQFAPFFPLLLEGARDDRNFVRKAVSWALRQIGKNRPSLRAQAIRTARDISRIDSRTARWIASDVLRELAHYAG